MRAFRAVLAMIAALIAAAALAAGPPRRAASPAWERVVSVTPQGGYRMGNPAAPVKLVEYGSRTCPICARFAAAGFPGIRGYVARGRVSFEFRDYPVHGAIDLAPILLGRCVSPRQFFPVLEAMYTAQPQLSGRSAQIGDDDQARLQTMTANQVAGFLGHFYGYDDFAARRGMPATRIAACLADRPALEAIATRANAAELGDGINSTPTFLINGKTAYAVTGWPALEAALKAAGA